MLPPPIPVQKGGAHYGFSIIFYCRCCGWCSLPLHHQMVRWRQIAGNQPVDISLSTPKLGIENPSECSPRGFHCCSLWNSIIFLPTGIIAYADHEINMQMSLKKIKKSKLSPWFMPCFSKNGSVDGFIVFSRYTSLAIASFAMLNIVGYTNDISKTSVGMFPCQRYIL